MEYSGIGVSPAKAVAMAVVLHKSEYTPDPTKLSAEATEGEWINFGQVRTELADRYLARSAQLAAQQRDVQAALLKTHRSILGDKLLVAEIERLITQEYYQAPYAVHLAVQRYIDKMSAMENAYIQERIADLNDVGDKLIRALMGILEQDFAAIAVPFILVAKDIEPSLISSIDPANLKGIVTVGGSKTSHTAIVANILGIAAVVACHDAMQIPQGAKVFVDGTSGRVAVVDDSNRQVFAQLLQGYQREQAELEVFKTLETRTCDGQRIQLCVNLADSKVPERVLQLNPDGVGLFRTEFLFMDRTTLPSEEEQYAHYLAIAKSFAPQTVIIRTMDIGGDKQAPCLQLDPEENPFLGYRAIRISLDREELFQTQLRAILRANHYGNLQVMYPMISSVSELLGCKGQLERAAASLAAEQVPHNADLPQGIMIETPAAALIADHLAEQCGFFSIGSNDLTQYALAVDRMNPHIAALYQPYSPSVLRLVAMAAQAIAKDRWIGICGELGGEVLAVPLLLGLGITEFSVSPSKLLAVRKQILSSSLQKAQVLAKQALQCATAAEVVALLEAFSVACDPA